MLDTDGINVAVTEEAIRAAVAEWPEACREERFGTRLVAVRADFRALPDDVVEHLLTEAWEARAPTRLVRARRELDR
jgi:hypothetical protein